MLAEEEIVSSGERRSSTPIFSFVLGLEQAILKKKRNANAKLQSKAVNLSTVFV
jgi:hypothetical protein